MATSLAGSLTLQEGPSLRLRPALPAADTHAPGEALLVEDAAESVEPGQMRRGELLAEVRSAVSDAVESALGGTSWSGDQCPYLDFVFTYAARRDAAHLEQLLRRFAPELEGATSAREYISFVADRARLTAANWLRTGEISGLPPGIPTAFSLFGRDAERIGTAPLLKARDGTPRGAADPVALQRRLGPGAPLEARVRARMEQALGANLSAVRTHMDSGAAGLSRTLGARAFTVGHHVAFDRGEYRPDSIAGDALIAHELAHVIQQGGADRLEPSDRAGALEADADRSAAGAVAGHWARAAGRTGSLPVTMPRHRTGLRLQRCHSRGGGGGTRATPTGSPARAPAPATSPSDFLVRGKIRNPSDTDNIYFERESVALDATELGKIPTVITSHGISSNLTLNGFRSEDEPVARAMQRANAVSTELGTARTTGGPPHPAHTGVRTPVDNQALSEGHLDYRNWRKVEVLGTPVGLPAAPTRMPPPCPAGAIPCRPAPNAFTQARTEALRIVNTAVGALNAAALTATTAAGTLTASAQAAQHLLRDLFGGTDPSPAVRLATGLGHAPTVRGHLASLHTHITAMTAAGRMQCLPACAGGCADRPGFNNGVGPSSIMSLCESFFDPARTLSQNAETLIHEGCHGTAGLGATDVAYGTTRMFPFLTDAQALQNADSYTYLAVLIDQPGSLSIGPPAASADIATGMNAGEERLAREAVAHLEKWMLLAEFDTEQLYDTVHRSLPPAPAWANQPGDAFNRETMQRISPIFGLTPPGATAPFVRPTPADQHRIAAIFDRYLQMRRVVYSHRLTINKITTGSEAWTAGTGAPGAGAGASFSVLPAFFAAANPTVWRVRRLVELLAAATPDVSPAMAQKLVDGADQIRQHRRAGP